MKEIFKRHTNVLQSDSLLVERLMSIAASKLYQLENAQDIPYFGKIDLLVGRFDVTNRGFIYIMVIGIGRCL